MLADLDFDGGVEEAAEALQISQEEIYRLTEDDDFINSVTALSEKVARAKARTVWQALIAQCEKGNIQAIKLYFQLMGQKVPGETGTNDEAGKSPWAGLTDIVRAFGQGQSQGDENG